MCLFVALCPLMATVPTMCLGSQCCKMLFFVIQFSQISDPHMYFWDADFRGYLQRKTKENYFFLNKRGVAYQGARLGPSRGSVV